MYLICFAPSSQKLFSLNAGHSLTELFPYFGSVFAIDINSINALSSSKVYEVSLETVRVNFTVY